MGVLDQIKAVVPVENQILLILGFGFIVFGLIFFLRRGGSGQSYVKIKKMNRKQIETRVSSLENEILKLDKMINSKKIKEHDVERRFSIERSEKLKRELNKTRKELTELANKRDRLLEEKRIYSRAYREATF